MEGISCDYGSTLCCGETFPEMVLTCMGGSWEGYYIDTPCILFPGHTSKMASHNEMHCQYNMIRLLLPHHHLPRAGAGELYLSGEL